ncbi:MAG: hypothetical protein ACRD9R_11560 [Pyrinomonadaceae bacterium]
MTRKVSLLIIDPQVDFCDPQRGALYVPGAEEDMRRLAAMIRRGGDQFDAIHVTLDSHHYVHIAHPVFWRDREGNQPPPFTRITLAEVEQGAWTPARSELRERALAYVRRLAENARYELTIWPPHCLIGSPGHNVFPELYAALLKWEQHYAVVDYVPKGSNLYTEHYSAIQADVPDPEDPSTQLNRGLIDKLESADLIAVAGEARTHCLSHTVRDLVNNLSDPAHASRLVLLTDATSDIPGFETCAADFMREMRERGLKFSTTTEFSV